MSWQGAEDTHLSQPGRSITLGKQKEKANQSASLTLCPHNDSHTSGFSLCGRSPGPDPPSAHLLALARKGPQIGGSLLRLRTSNPIVSGQVRHAAAQPTLALQHAPLGEHPSRFALRSSHLIALDHHSYYLSPIYSTPIASASSTGPSHVRIRSFDEQCSYRFCSCAPGRPLGLGDGPRCTCGNGNGRGS